MTTTTKLPTFEDVVRTANDTYIRSFGTAPEIACCAPGRVNLIGEHVDYNDGYVLPMALPMVTVILGSKNNTTNEINIRTCCKGADEPLGVKFNTNDLKAGHPKWANYVKGVIKNFEYPVPGFNAVIATNVPVGGGLSSSAALEVSTLTFIQEIAKKYIESDPKKALICQKAEHTFAGMPCGIMDQFISVSGQDSHALLIDCRSLETFQIPFKAPSLAILICNSNVRHELSSSEYPTRRRQCSEALQVMGLHSYREATEGHLSALNSHGKDVLLKRARHVITEIHRTLEAAESLKRHDFETMGDLMTKSHMSLRDDFEVSCRELDILVESATSCPGVLGSRMTGGGFGGCTVTLMRKDYVQDVINKIKEDFQQNFKGIQPDFYICTPSSGSRVLNLKEIL